MDDPLMYRILADGMLVVHFAFVVFVVVGFLLILIGLAADWNWVRNWYFRVAHLVAIAVVVLQAWAGRICPLTLWENVLRQRAGQETYTETFVQHWLHRLLFYEAEPWVFTTIYTVFGALVLLVWWFGKSSGRG